jgi:hypothetical protein
MFQTYPANIFVQTASINLEQFKTSVKMNIVFGINDDLLLSFNEKNWTFMNDDWLTFREKNSNLIDASDFWEATVSSSERCLRNAKLYPLFNMEKALKAEFWIDSRKKSVEEIKIWKQSYRLSIEDILKSSDISKLFQNRRHIFNLVNLKTLVKSVIQNKAIQFNDIIQNAVLDGYAFDLLKFFDDGNLLNDYISFFLLDKKAYKIL